MKTEELKALVKIYVKQALTETLAEKFLQNIVKEAVMESMSATRLVERVAPAQKQSRAAPAKSSFDKEEFRRKALDKMGINNSILSEVYADTLRSDNPILSGQTNNDDVEQVSEDALADIGVFNKDWSKFIPGAK